MKHHFLDKDTEARLLQFFGGRFHQDWDVNGATWQEVMDRWLPGVATRTLAVLRRDLEAVISHVPDDDAVVAEYLFSLGCEYLPAPEPARNWMHALVEHIGNELKRRGAPQLVD